MGNQVRNGRNYKDSIIKLSINSFSTNSAIHDNLQENTTKISTIDDIPICFLSDLYLDKIF